MTLVAQLTNHLLFYNTIFYLLRMKLDWNFKLLLNKSIVTDLQHPFYSTWPPSFSSHVKKGRERRWPQNKTGVVHRYQATVKKAYTCWKRRWAFTKCYFYHLRNPDLGKKSLHFTASRICICAMHVVQATGLDARTSRVKCPAQFMSHRYGISFTEYVFECHCLSYHYGHFCRTRWQ